MSSVKILSGTTGLNNQKYSLLLFLQNGNMAKFPYKTFSEVLTLVILCMLRDILEQERGKFLNLFVD